MPKPGPLTKAEEAHMRTVYAGILSGERSAEIRRRKERRSKGVLPESPSQVWRGVWEGGKG